jgi:glutaredoxin-like protein NrdH
MKTITVYTKPACQQCNAVFRTLDKMGLEYRRIDISTDPDAREYIMALGYLQAVPPTTTFLIRPRRDSRRR